MRKYTEKILLAGLLLAGLSGKGQHTATPLQIGDKVPNIELNRIYNGETGADSLYHFLRKGLILVFWDVSCAPCIANMPREEALQKSFGDEIQILLVTKNSNEAVNRLFNRSEIARDCRLPMIIGDTILTKLFSYMTVPCYAWVDKEGTLRSFTGESDKLTEENIKNLIAGRIDDMAQKEEYNDFNPKMSLITEGGGRNLDHLKYYSILTSKIRFDNKYKRELRDPETGLWVGLYYLNYSMVELFMQAYGRELHTGGFRIRENRVKLNMPDRDSYLVDKNRENYQSWRQENWFAYESCLPPRSYEKINRRMIADLEMYFNVATTVEPQSVSCLVLKSLPDSDPGQSLATDGGKRVFDRKSLPQKILLQNCHFSYLIGIIETLFDDIGTNKPFINETGIDIDFLIDMKIEGNLDDLDDFRSQLRKYGLDLSSEERKLNVLVITGE